MTDEQLVLVERLRFLSQAVPGWNIGGMVLGMKANLAEDTLSEAAVLIEYLLSELDRVKAENERIRQNYVSHEVLKVLWEGIGKNGGNGNG